jgi:hypothetical protein
MQREFKGIFIPAEIWNDEKLTLSERVLFAEIDSFSKNGECFASNAHFAKLLKISARQIQNYLKSLREKGYIETTFIFKKDSKEIEKRIITPLFGYGKKEHHPTTEMTRGDVQPYTYPPAEPYAPPYVESCVDNNSLDYNPNNNNPLNKKTNKKKSISPPSAQLEDEFERLWKSYPRKMGKANALKSFIKARKNKKIPYEIIENGLYRYINYLEAQGTEEQYILYGSTWFSSEKWQDEYICTTPQKKPKNALEYFQQKHGGASFEPSRNGEIIEYYPTMLPESL